MGNFTKRIFTLDNLAMSNITLGDFSQGNSTLGNFALGNPWEIHGQFTIVIPVTDKLSLGVITRVKFILGILHWVM